MPYLNPPTGSTDRYRNPEPENPFRIWGLRILFFLTGAVIVYAWGIYSQQIPLPRFLQKSRIPYEQYASRLKEANLDRSGLGKAWIEAGRQVLWDSLLLELPLKEAGYFPAEKAMARSFLFDAVEGEMIEATLTWTSIDTPLVFLDLFRIGPDRFMERIAFADSGSWALNYPVSKGGQYLLRMQPELFHSLGYELTLSRGASLAFPVSGKDAKAIQSFFGAPRDGGKRSHKGVDIFAPRGTPVLAAAPGKVIHVKEEGLGGKVVWVQSASGGRHYFAHLDEQWVRRGQRVASGDTIGLVGNTGNARNTPSHLHFGIYLKGRGAVDPYPFIRYEDKDPDPVSCPLAPLGEWQRVAGKEVFLRSQPDRQAKENRKLAQYQPLHLLAAQRTYYRVRTVSGEEGYVSSRELEALNRLEALELQESIGVREMPHASSAVIAQPQPCQQVSLLAREESYGLVELPGGMRGWMALPVHSTGTGLGTVFK